MIVGLAFEYSGDVKRDLKQVATYRERHDIAYPTLLAGLAEKDVAAKMFKGLDRVRAFPTTLFVNHRGELVAVHTGFSGPATGDEYQKTRQAFAREAQALVAAAEVAKQRGEAEDEQPLPDAIKDAEKASKKKRTKLKAKAKKASRRSGRKR